MTDGFTVSFVWCEQKSWLVAGALFLFPMLAIQKRLGMITGLNHLTKKKKKINNHIITNLSFNECIPVCIRNGFMPMMRPHA